MTIALAEKGAAYATISVDRFKNGQYSPAYLAINPKGVVPSLVDDGEVIVESTLICEYLDEAIPAPALAPPDAHGRVRIGSAYAGIANIPGDSWDFAFAPEAEVETDKMYRAPGRSGSASGRGGSNG